jgi:hypothetical protein
MRTCLTLSALALLGFLAAPLPAGAIVPASAGGDCPTLGATQWSANNTGLLGCGLVAEDTAPPANVCATAGMCQ